jgi:hypothetical protein
MAAQSTCGIPDCESPVFHSSPFGQCAAHLFEHQPVAFHTELQKASDVDLGGVSIDDDLLQHVLSQCSTPGTQTINKPLSFENATFEDDVILHGLVFAAHTLFDGATFRKSFRVVGTSFHSDCSFSKATFHEGASFVGSVTTGTFDGCTFKGDAQFVKCTFTNGAYFLETTFEKEASFGGATFAAVVNEDGEEDSIIFEKAVFKGPAMFQLADFGAKAIFDGARFEQSAHFGETLFVKNASFEATRFESDVDMKFAKCGGALNMQNAKFRGDANLELVTAGELLLEDADFGERAIIRATTMTAHAHRCRFRKGVSIGLRYATIDCKEARFEGASTLFTAPLIDENRVIAGGLKTKVASRQAFSESSVVEGWTEARPADSNGEKRLPERAEQSKLLSLESADVAGLHIADTVDLTLCRFANAHNLEKIRFEGRPQFADAPKRRSRRMVIAEEQLLRHNASDRRKRVWKVDDRIKDATAPTPRHIESVYRSLRKGLEDSGDPPGAGDFYYGEMEMRRWSLRKAARNDRSTRTILYLYWLISGYALRASRAFLGLLVVLLLGATCLAHAGFATNHKPQYGITKTFHGLPYYSEVKPEPKPTYRIAFLDSAQTVVLGKPEAQLTGWGHTIVIVVRVLGAALLGLAILSIRGRVKR